MGNVKWQLQNLGAYPSTSIFRKSYPSFLDKGLQSGPLAIQIKKWPHSLNILLFHKREKKEELENRDPELKGLNTASTDRRMDDQRWTTNLLQ